MFLVAGVLGAHSPRTHREKSAVDPGTKTSLQTWGEERFAAGDSLEGWSQGRGRRCRGARGEGAPAGAVECLAGPHCTYMFVVLTSLYPQLLWLYQPSPSTIMAVSLFTVNTDGFLSFSLFFLFEKDIFEPSLNSNCTIKT